MSCDRYARMIIKTGQGVPTIPPSADHRNGDWLDTDIYEGELYQDTDTGLIYSRNGSTIYNVGGVAQKAIYSANLTQTGTNAPTADVFENTLGGTVTFGYTSPGVYTASLTGAFTADKTFILVNTGHKNGFIRCWRVDADTIRIESYNNAFVIGNGILEDTSIRIEVYA